MNNEIDLHQIISEHKSIMEAAYQKLVVVSVKKDTLIHCTKYPQIHPNLGITNDFRQFEKSMVRRVPKLVEHLIKDKKSPIVVVDYFELLFEPALHINPIEFFLNISKIQKIILVWRYEIKNNSLIYSKPNHPDYFNQKLPSQILVIKGGK